MAKIIKKNRGSDLTMTKEQEAIEICKKKIIEPFYDFPNPTSIELKDTDVEAIETVLSMIEKKDKQIDLMAEHIAFNQKVNSYEDIKTYKEQIKQHYENQSKLFKYDYNKKSTLDINSNAKI